jgi:hypothetical protein
MALLGVQSSRYIPYSRFNAILCIKRDSQQLTAGSVCWSKEVFQYASGLAGLVIPLAGEGLSKCGGQSAFCSASQWRKVVRLRDPNSCSLRRLRQLHELA